MEVVKYKILLVEDTLIAQKIAELVLGSLGCELDIVDKGYEALELATHNCYHLILMDIGLPDIDGLSLTKLIRQSELSDTHVPIIALTAHSEETIGDQIREAGLDDYLIKPLTYDVGQQLLAKYI